MRNQIAIVVILLAMGLIAFITFNSRVTPNGAVVVNPQGDVEDRGGYLTFEAYLLDEELYRGSIASVDFSGREDAKTYQSIIEEGVKSSGVNFAGTYSVVTWGCGTNCQVSTIVDVVTGLVVEYGIVSSYGLAYSPWSSLFIVNPIENIPVDVANNENISSDFYELGQDTGLLYLRKHITEGPDNRTCNTLTASARNTFTREVRDFSSGCSIPYGWKIIQDAL